MLTRRFLTVPLALTLAAMSSNAASDIPRIGKPRPAPATTPHILPLPPAVIDNNLQIGGDNVKAREVDTRLSVDVRVNERGPYHFVVDSGADTSVVGTRMAQALQLPMGTPVILNGMTGRNIVDRVKVAALTLGPTTVSDLEVPALREIDLGADGLVGIDALVNQRLMMDFEKHVIKVEDASIPMRHLPGEILITAKRRRGQLILTQVRASRFKLDAVIDTGSEITIGNTALRDKLLRKGHTQFWDVEATGVTGQKVMLHLARIDGLQLGPITLQDVPSPLPTCLHSSCSGWRTSRHCCLGPTCCKPSDECRSTSARARSGSSSAAASRRGSASTRGRGTSSRRCFRPRADRSASGPDAALQIGCGKPLNSAPVRR